MRLVALLAATCLAAGCDQLLGLRDLHQAGAADSGGIPHDDGGGGPADAPGPAYCGDQPFATASITNVPGLEGVIGGDPAFGMDEGEIFFSTGGASSQIYRATRDQGGPFVVETTAAFGGAADPNADPSITADGQTAVYVDLSSDKGYLVERVTATMWTTPIVLTVGGIVPAMVGVEIAPDGSQLYFTDALGHLLQAPTIDLAGGIFGLAVDVTPPNNSANGVRYPSISADQRELFFPGGGLYHATRGSITESFSDAASITPNGNDPEISVDGQRLYFVYLDAGSGQPALGYYERTCPVQ